MVFFSDSFEAPFSLLYLVADGSGLCYLGVQPPSFSFSTASCPVLKQAKEQLQLYFQNPITPLNVALSLRGTDLQKKIWHYLAKNVLTGQKVSYLDLAKTFQTGARVIGQSMSRNPLPLFIPCHRVLRHDGSLGGYSLGGTKVKQFLLEHEVSI